MASEISFLNGKAEAACALRPAWWDVQGEYVLDHVPDSEGMIKAAHLGWHVDVQPIYGHDGRIIPGYSTTVRTDTGVHLGIMSDQYQVVQNREAFSFLDNLLKDGVMRYESAGALRGGRTVWALARMPSVDEVAEGDQLNRYILWLNSHDGMGAIYAIPTSIRVVCQNTASLAIRNQRGIRHIGDVSSRLKQAHNLLSQADKSFTDYVDKSRILVSRHYTSDKANQYIETLLPVPKFDGRAATIRESRVRMIREAFKSERNQLPSIRGSWWALLNSVTEAIDHDRFYTFKGRGVVRAENRMQSLLMGQAAEFKTKAFDLALALAT